MSTPLVIDEGVRARAKQVVEYAAANKLNIHTMMKQLGDQQAGILEPVGHDVKRQLHIPMGYIAVYSIEQHYDGWYHHLSMSSPVVGRVPVPASVSLVLEAMGLPPIKTCVKVWVEELTGGHSAINLLLPYESPP